MSDAGSDISDPDDGQGGFDPHADVSQLTDKERKKVEKNLSSWRIFMDFLVRHVAIATFKYNSFQLNDLTSFMIAMEKAEALRGSKKLKKGEVAEIKSFKVMKDSTDLLLANKYVAEANRIRNFLDICGRMRGISMIAGGFYKALKKGKVRGIDKIKYYSDFWKGFCSRSFDFTELGFKNTDIESFNALEQKYLVWPTVVRTAIFLSQKFLKRCSESTGLDLITSDPKAMQKHMQAAEFVVATKIEEMLFQKVVQETKTFLLGTPLVPSSSSDTRTQKWELPPLEDIDPDLLKAIPEDGMLMILPDEPPKDKKKKKGGKKGKGKGSAKGGKKKKK